MKHNHDITTFLKYNDTICSCHRFAFETRTKCFWVVGVMDIDPVCCIS